MYHTSRSSLADTLMRMPIIAAPQATREDPIAALRQMLYDLHLSPDDDAETRARRPDRPPPAGEGGLRLRGSEESHDMNEGPKPPPDVEIIEEGAPPRKKIPPASEVGGMTAKDLENFADAFHKRLFGTPRQTGEDTDNEFPGKPGEFPPLPGEVLDDLPEGAKPIIQKRTEIRMTIPTMKPGAPKRKKKPKENKT